MRRSLVVLATLIFLVGIGVKSAYPIVLYDNLYSSNDWDDPVLSYGPLADSFSTGTAGFSLTDVQLVLSGDLTYGGSLLVSLYSDSSTSPGSDLLDIGSLSDSNLSGTPSVFDFSLTSPDSLAANTRYWIAVSGNTSAYWESSFDQTALGVTGEYYSNQSGVWSNDLLGPYQMRVSGDNAPVPEPPSLLLVFSTVAALVAFKKKFGVA